jgi:hypothetical protein
MASGPRKGKGKRRTAATDVTQPAGFNALEIAEAGRRVYERHRIDFERHHPGQYVLIDVRTEKVFTAESPEAAYRQVAPDQREGPFYLVRVGERAAFRSRRQPNGDAVRIAR